MSAPGGAAAKEGLDVRGVEGSDVVAQGAVEDASAAVIMDKCHRVVFAVHFGFGGGEKFDGTVAGEAGVEFVDGVEGFETAGDGVVGPADVDAESTVRVVASEFGIPTSSGEGRR